MRKGWVTDSQTEDLSGVIESVKELSIVEVLAHYGVRFKGNRRRPLALCPFHMDKNTGSFVVNVSKNATIPNENNLALFRDISSYVSIEEGSVKTNKKFFITRF